MTEAGAPATWRIKADEEVRNFKKSGCKSETTDYFIFWDNLLMRYHYSTDIVKYVREILPDYFERRYMSLAGSTPTLPVSTPPPEPPKNVIRKMRNLEKVGAPDTEPPVPEAPLVVGDCWYYNLYKETRDAIVEIKSLHKGVGGEELVEYASFWRCDSYHCYRRIEKLCCCTISEFRRGMGGKI
jgi:hypothetical protein